MKLKEIEWKTLLKDGNLWKLLDRIFETPKDLVVLIFGFVVGYIVPSIFTAIGASLQDAGFYHDNAFLNVLGLIFAAIGVILDILVSLVLLVVWVYGIIYLIRKAHKIDGYIPMPFYLILLVLTLGLYQPYWYYKVTKYFKETIPEETRSPFATMMLCLFVPFYHIYFVYMTAKRVDTVYASKGVDKDVKVIALILELLVWVVGANILLQWQLNTALKMEAVGTPIVKATTVTATAPVAPATPAITPEAASMKNNVALLKEYKELLDTGVITQEEFDKKKQELL